MVLEGTVICVDNSDFMRNGDVAPSRMQARPASASRALALAGQLSRCRRAVAPREAARSRADAGGCPPDAQAQADAVNLLAGAKTQSNPESCVGVLSLAGKVPKMLVTPTPDLGKVLNSMHGLQMDGAVHFSTGVQARFSAQPSARRVAGRPRGGWV
jgi:hypothetical protein